MPYVLDTPENVPDKDRYMILKMQWDLPANDINATSVRVTYMKGHDSGGTFIGDDVYHECILQGTALVNKMNELVTPTKTNYEQVKEAIWSLVAAQEGLGSGTTQ